MRRERRKKLCHFSKMSIFHMILIYSFSSINDHKFLIKVLVAKISANQENSYFWLADSNCEIEIVKLNFQYLLSGWPKKIQTYRSHWARKSRRNERNQNFIFNWVKKFTIRPVKVSPITTLIIINFVVLSLKISNPPPNKPPPRLVKIHHKI